MLWKCMEYAEGDKKVRREACSEDRTLEEHLHVREWAEEGGIIKGD